ncbi:MAG TPA: hypothetical protein VHK69_00340, partial [Chitinophagaceae bacterium]|nr:hypothetical protein [Chitinophagaceae bacterium]
MRNRPRRMLCIRFNSRLIPVDPRTVPGLLAFLLLSVAGSAQQPITTVATTTNSVATGTTYSGTGAPASAYSTATTYNYRYGSSSGFTNNKVFLNNFVAGGTTYAFEYGFSLTVNLRRVNNAVITGTRDLLYNEGAVNTGVTPNQVNINAPYIASMNTVFIGNDDLRSGTDNLFGNQGDGNGNNNNIERLDVHINGTGGYLVGNASLEGFAVFERGGAGGHDPFVVSVITALDASGNPSAYTAVKRMAAADYGASNPVTNANYIVLRRDGGTGNLLASAGVSAQGIGGIFFRFADFGIAAGTRVYGYSLAGGDFPVGGTGANLVNVTNATYFPTATNGAAEGGIDFAAITGVFRTFNNDLDAFFNNTDIDDDNDGIPDLVENGGYDGFGDADGDGSLNYVDVTPGVGVPAFADANGDGVNDAYDADKDGRINQIDLDADNDGIPDLVEAGGTDINGDGLVDVPTDTDNDGLANTYDASTGGNNIVNLDTDGDGIRNFLDLDSDNDGIPDVAEVGGVDTNGDGRLDNYNDADSDGLDDTVDSDVGNDGTAENAAGVLLRTGADTNSDGRPESYPFGIPNTDGRSLPNPYDLDSDNDGIADVIEAGGTDANNDGRTDGYVDTDGDGFSDPRDGDVGNDGTAENTAGTLLSTGPDANNDGHADSYVKANADGAGRPNPYDLDSDNDNVPDLIESGGVDSNGDGRIDDLNDSDGNGWQNTYDPTQGGRNLRTLDANGAGTGGLVFDFDGDTIPNYLDLDADNDGIPDIIEQGAPDSDNDGKADGTVDVDDDGFNDAVDPLHNGTGAALGTAIITTGTVVNAFNMPSTYSAGDNADGGSLINMLDLDADGDGILDVRESGLTDTDNNGIADGTTGTDGWSDTVDGPAVLGLLNTDGHGLANYLDIDADNDGIVDLIEGQSTAGYLAPAGADDDADGIDNAYDNNDAGFAGTNNNGITPVNTDGADNPDYLDLDTDNDGYSDRTEGWDTNGNNSIGAGEVGYAGTSDADGDGLLDEYDSNDAASNPANGTTPVSYPNADRPSTPERDWREASDSDADGIGDGVDVDDDNDGIPDTAESGNVDPLGDADGDGVPNYQDTTPGAGLPAFADTNADGINDAYDADRDGVLNALDLDSDNDGIADIVEAGGVDTNGDGRVDTFTDGDNDGLATFYDSNNGGVNIARLDTDGDGIANAYDLDSDNDGIADIIEAGGTDANNNGTADVLTDTDGDGFVNAYDGDADNAGGVENTAAALIITGTDGNGDGRPDAYARANFDGTALPNPYDLDADGDGILDTREANVPDTDNDGRVNGAPSGAADPNGWSNIVDGNAGGTALLLPNTDGTGRADYLDIDADDDGITDNVEGQSTAGYQAPTGSDSDGDGIDDRYDNNDAAFAGAAGNGILPNNHDGDAQPDYRDTDTDSDGKEDRIEGNDFNGNGRPDDVVTPLGTDTDSDGLDDRYETSVSNGPVVTVLGFSGAGAG